MTLAPGRMLSHYKLIELIGEGGMGAVWRSKDQTLGREVALKVLDAEAASSPERLAMFEREARAIAALNHPNIVTIYEIDKAEGLHFIVMELVRGGSLEKLIQPGGLPLKKLLDVAIAVTEAIDAAHKQGITHRDLKPSNIMMSETVRVKVVDFGLAVLSPPESTVEGKTLTTLTAHTDEEFMAGTLPYMSPEQVQGLDVGSRSDIFSTGVILYEMATGRQPFEGANSSALIASILRDIPIPPTRLNPQLPLRLGRIINSCLEKDPKKRWQSAAELRRALGDIRSDLDEETHSLDRSVAVLPFRDMSPDRDQDYLCEGIAEEIMTALSKVRGLRVASRPSAFRFNSADTDVAEVGEKLGVSTLLDGSVRKSGDRLRISVELIDATDGFRLWSDRYDREIRDVFAVQDEIARRVVEALQLTLSAGERDALRKTSTRDINAYDYYLRGRKFFYMYNKRGIAFARELFERAIAIDPSYARAYAGIADCCSFQYLYVGRDPVNLEKAAVAAAKAIELDPELAEAHASLGTALSLRGRHSEAEDAFRTAIRLNSDLFEAHYFYARDSFAQGKLEQAIREYEEAVRSRPGDYQAPLLVGQIYDDLGHSEEAAASRRRGVAIAEEHLNLNPDDVRALYMGANGLVALGEHKKGLDWARRALALEPDDPMVIYNVACIYSLAGRAAEALDCIERAVDAGLTQRGWLEHDSNLDLIRKEPRFQALLKRLE
jgi:serine/threonine protein kinase/tetratricopeptide (TPR) repeat protein